MPPKKICIKTYGCAMNVYDSMRMTDMFYNQGYENCENPQDADLVILNTCHIREKAAEKVYSELGRIKKLTKHKESKTVIAVAGCVGQAEGDEIFRRAPYVDIVVGPQSYQSLPDLVGKVLRDSGHHIDLELKEDKFDTLPEESSQADICAILSVQEGCDKFCTFCVVPYTRGAEYSRDVSKIYREALKLVARGAKEITLLGQNVNAFHGTAANGEVWNLGKIIKHLTKIEGLERIRYSTSHPRDMHEDLYDAHLTEPKLMPYLHLPVQSGSDSILNAMNRKHTRDYYFKIIDHLKTINADLQFSSDFIVGFPGETEKDFEDTLDLVKRVGFTQGYSYCYSPRPGTPSADMNNQVEEYVKKERLQILQQLINEQQLNFNKSCIGKIMPVLFDGNGRGENQKVGRSPYMQSVIVNNAQDNLIGTMKDIRIIDGQPRCLFGELI